MKMSSCLSIIENNNLHSILPGFVVNGINNVNVTAIERRFDLPSTKVGIVSSAYDFAAGIFAIPVAFVATYGNQVW